MKHVLIVEKAQEKLITESAVSGSGKMLLNGIFTEFDVENRNKRFYNASNFIPCMNVLLEKKRRLGVVYGEFDHPDVFDIAGKNISHAVESLTHNEEANRVDGSIALLSNHWGKQARAIIEDGYPLFVSSRAAGVTDGSGNVMLKELFTYDIVVDPGFESARVSVNESFGFTSGEDIPYRIYEMNDSNVNTLFNDNKNDNKTQMNIKEMEMFLATEMAKIEHQLYSKIAEGKTAPEEITALVEKHQMVVEELAQVKQYLDVFQKKIQHLIKENSKLVSENKKLADEINENTLYSNHIQDGLNNIKENVEILTERVTVDELFIEEVAKETEVAQKFAESIAKETEIAQKFAESVAKETELTQKIVEKVEIDANITRKFAEYNAQETKATQGLLEHIAKELQKDDIYLNYIAEKVDGIVEYTSESISKIKTTVPLSESMTEENSIHSVEDIKDYLGITDENQIINNVIEENLGEEVTEDDENTEEVIEDENQEDGGVIDNIETQEETPIISTEGDNVETPVVEPSMGEEPVIGEEPIAEPVMGMNGDNIDMTQDMTQTDNIGLDNQMTDTTLEPSMETTLLSALVKILGSDETGIVLEITPEDKLVIQKSGSDETFEMGKDEVEVIDNDDNVAERVSSVLDEIKKQNALANQQPHFFSFLSEEQVTDFRLLEKETQNNIILAFENAEYFNTQDVLNIIGETVNKQTVSYEDNLITNIPTEIKEAWNNLSQEQKVSVITESKYFSLHTKGDIKSFWNTRPFAKAVNSSEATLIKESLTTENNEDLSENYVDAFLKTIENLK